MPQTDVTKTETEVATPKRNWREQLLKRSQQLQLTWRWPQQLSQSFSQQFRNWQYGCIGLGAVATALLTAANPDWVQALEYQMQTAWQETRGKNVPPDNVLIVAIDDDSLAQGQLYQTDPTGLKALAPIQTWPWRRQAYAQVIDRLTAAGARVIGIDVLFTTPSVYGAADDQMLAQALQRAGDRVVLASRYSMRTILQGEQVELITPLENLPAKTGFINMLQAADGRIHLLGHRFTESLRQRPEFSTALPIDQPVSFADAVLQAGRIPVTTTGDQIGFYGPSGTFRQIPVWMILDPASWQTSLENGQIFRDKIVLIGSTAPIHQDQQRVPFANSWRYPESMFGVEVQANAVANLQTGTALRSLIPTPWGNALLAGVVVVLAGGVVHLQKAPLARLGLTAANLLTWSLASYGLLVVGKSWVPIGLPLAAIISTGTAQVVLELTRRHYETKKLRAALKSHLSLPLIQEIVDQQEDLRDLLGQREQEVNGKVLSSRYEIVKLLGVGGFGETYIAKDWQRPSQPLCVVKQLKLERRSSRRIKLMRRLFQVEAEALEKLGNHDQIPQLLAYFEELDEFYLVQELIVGTPLNHILKQQQRLPVPQVLHFLQDVLIVLTFVHQQQVLHRDIKPSNLMRRHADRKWMLIDFGVAKHLNRLAENEGVAPQTVGVGTKGYVPPEQALGQPNPTSDLYALGMTAIEILTGVAARDLSTTEAGEVDWLEQAPSLSPEMTQWLNSLVQPDYRHRPATAAIALTTLYQLPEAQALGTPAPELAEMSDQALPLTTDDTPTQRWNPPPAELPSAGGSVTDQTHEI
jgi:CHASE2 domain-containing sensor protein/tRNA A-37 threonylcarbamoyl transferase component Bud32